MVTTGVVLGAVGWHILRRKNNGVSSYRPKDNKMEEEGFISDGRRTAIVVVVESSIHRQTSEEEEEGIIREKAHV